MGSQDYFGELYHIHLREGGGSVFLLYFGTDLLKLTFHKN